MFSPGSKVEANRISIPLPLHGESTPQSSTDSSSIFATPKQNMASELAAALPSQDDAATLDDAGAASDIAVSSDYGDQPHQELVDSSLATEADRGEWKRYHIKSGDTLSVLFQ